MLHPVYDDDRAVEALTREHLRAGRTVLQMFQLADDEETHSLRVLAMMGQPQLEIVRVLSLGCGVGGMEAHWHRHRPGWEFELVNLSQPQLDLCVCHGRRVCADITDYRSRHAPFDLTVLAYVLGHAEPAKTLAAARANTRKGGVVAVVDVFDGTPQFDDFFCYGTPTAEEMHEAGFVEQPTCHAWRLINLIHDTSPWAARHATPAIWTRLV